MSTKTTTLFKALKKSEKKKLLKVFKRLADDDCTALDFYDSGYLQDTIIILIAAKLAWTASDSRIKLSPEGEIFLQDLEFDCVDLPSKYCKLQYNYE
jgi:hypothetical protein